jgi:hypothetical protein
MNKKTIKDKLNAWGIAPSSSDEDINPNLFKDRIIVDKIDGRKLRHSVRKRPMPFTTKMTIAMYQELRQLSKDQDRPVIAILEEAFQLYKEKIKGKL